MILLLTSISIWISLFAWCCLLWPTMINAMRCLEALKACCTVTIFLLQHTRPTVAFLMAFFLIQATGQKWQWSRIETCLCELCMHRYKGTICTFTQSLQLPRWLRLRLSTKKPASSSSSKFAQAHMQASLLASASQLEDVKSKGRLMKSGAQTSVFTVMAAFIVAACLAAADSWMMLCLCVASANTRLEFRNVSEKQLLYFLLVMKAFRIFTMNI